MTRITESDAADALVSAHGSHLRYNHSRCRWMIWDPMTCVWVTDERQSVTELARRFLATMGEARLLSARSIGAVLMLAQSHPAIATTADQYDQHPYVLATAAEYIDLKTGDRIARDPALLITQRTIVHAENGPPGAWLEFMTSITGGDEELAGFIQRMLGYCLTGDTREQVMFLMLGGAGTGKSTLVATAREIFGPYAYDAPMATFAARSADAHPTGIAAMAGKRLVTSSETPRGIIWNEALLKVLTGDGVVTARFMHRDFFTYRRRFKIVMVGNHAPVLPSTGDDIRRRVYVLPLTRRPAAIDQCLPEKLLSEAPRILNWMVLGALQWQQRGLDPPNAVREASRRLFEAQDIVGEWISACCDVGPGNREYVDVLYASYRAFAEARGERLISEKVLGAELEPRFPAKTIRTPDRPGTHRGRVGIRVQHPVPSRYRHTKYHD